MKSNRTPRLLPFGKSVTAACAGGCALGVLLAIAHAGPAPAPAAAPRPAAAAPTPAPAIALQKEDPDESIPSVLPGRPDQPGKAGSDAPNAALGKRFDSLSGGISLRPPAGMKPVREVGKDDIVAFVPDTGPDKPAGAAQGASGRAEVIPAPAPKSGPAAPAAANEVQTKLVVRRESFATAQPLISTPDVKGVVQPGLLENTVAALLKHVQGDAQLKSQPGDAEQLGGTKVLRQDLTNLGNQDVGMIVLRYTKENQRRLAQHAIVQANDQLFYVLSLTTAARKFNPQAADKARETELEESCEDPVEAKAVELFRAVLDSVTLLDRGKIFDDQRDRLFRTRTMLFNLSPQKLQALVPEQWLRIVRQEDNGGWRDIGYQYVAQQVEARGGQDNVYVGIRTRVVPGGPAKPFPRLDSEAILWSSMDRKHETWSKLTVHDDGKPKTPENPWFKVTEFGTSLLTTDHFLLDKQMVAPGAPGDPRQAPVGVKETYSLTVHHATSRGDFEPVERPLPPFYLPQALGAILPQVVPHNEPKTYLVASYVSDNREVMLRYIDVLPEQDVTLAGVRLRAVPIRDRVGLDGSAWTHYVTNSGYLGSDNKETKTAILLSNEKRLKTLWADANLSRPEDIERNAARGDGDAAPPAGAPPAGAGTPGVRPPGTPRDRQPAPPAPRRQTPPGAPTAGAGRVPR